MRARSLGGLIGIVVAVAGGFGAAVGFYSLPDPAHLTVEADVYARAEQRAMAVSTQGDCDDSCTVLRIDAGRGGSNGQDAGFGLSDGVPRATGSQDVSVYFGATLQTCSQGGQFCDLIGDWQAPSVPGTWFQFDPLMGSASFSGEVEGCQFDVTWTADGLIAPFAGYPQSSAGLGAWQAGGRLDDAYAEVSRVAPASVQMTPAPDGGSCEATALQQVNGFLSQGSRRVFGRGGAGFPEQG